MEEETEEKGGYREDERALMENSMRKKPNMEFSQSMLPSMNRSNSTPPPPPQSPPTQPLLSYLLTAASNASQLLPHLSGCQSPARSSEART